MIYSKNKNMNGPSEYKYVKTMVKSAWDKLKHNEHLCMLAASNVLVINVDEHWKLPMEQLSREEMHSFVDIFEVCYCHGKPERSGLIYMYSRVPKVSVIDLFSYF